MESYQKKFIELALNHGALQFGEFKLKSGRMSPYFFNMGKLCDGQALGEIGDCYAAAIHQSNIFFDVLFGPAYKGIPLVSASAISLFKNHHKNTPYCFNRKESKDHGEMGDLIGSPLKGRVMVIDDVITAGTALMESFKLIEQHEAMTAAVFVALDRQEKGQGEQSAVQEIQTRFGIPVVAIVTFEHIMEYVNHKTEYAPFKEKLVDYRQTYGI